MPSPSSASSSEYSRAAVPTRKRKQVEDESLESSEGHSATDPSDAGEEDSDAPQALLPLEEDIVLSHAERRRQKKRQNRDQLTAASPRKKRKLDDDDTGTSPPSNVSAKSKVKGESTTKATPTADDPRRQKRQNSVWVGNLSFRTTQDALRGFFNGAGTITRVHMPMRRGQQMQGENMGFAYVDFDTPEAKVIATTLSEGHLDGRKLLIKDGDDFTGRPVKPKTDASEGGEGEKLVKSIKNGTSLSKTAQKILGAQKQPPAPTLFLGNLGFETTDGSIRELFEAHRYWIHKDKGKGEKPEERDQGEVEAENGPATSKDVWIRKIRMGTFEDSGACKGFAFVDFTSIEHATKALINPRNHRLNGRNLVVEYASPDAVRRGGGPRKPKGDHDRKSGAPQRGSANASYTKQHRPRRNKQEDANDAAIPAETATTMPRSRRPDGAGHNRPHVRRAKPGAALAHAQRQSAAIVPGRGQKIVF